MNAKPKVPSLTLPTAPLSLIDGCAVGVDAILHGKNGCGTALWWAAGTGDEEGCELLLERAATVDLTAGTGHATALSNAVANGHTEVVRTLLRHGASPHVQTPSYCPREVKDALDEALDEARREEGEPQAKRVKLN